MSLAYAARSDNGESRLRVLGVVAVVLVGAGAAWADPVADGLAYLRSQQGVDGFLGARTGEDQVVATHETLELYRALELLSSNEAQSALVALGTTPAGPDNELIFRRAFALRDSSFALSVPLFSSHAPGFEADEAWQLSWSLFAQPAADPEWTPRALRLTALETPVGCLTWADNGPSADLTSLAVLALRNGTHPTVTASRAQLIACLKALQGPGGDFGNSPATTASAILALESGDQDLSPILTPARAYLLATQRSDGGWGTVRATALALHALLGGAPDWVTRREAISNRALLALSTGEVAQGGSVTAIVDVRNASGVVAPSVQVQLTATPSSGGAGSVVATAVLGSLQPGQSTQLPITFTTTGLGGRYTLEADIDPLRQRAELDRTNNTASAPLVVRLEADLAISSSSIRFPAGAPAGQAVATVTVRNLGSTLTTPVLVEVRKGGRTGALLGTFSTPSGLAQNADFAASVTFATAGVSGQTSVWAIADPSNQLTELDESNNAAFRFYELGADAPVDVALNTADFPSLGEVPINTQLTLAGSIRNQSSNDAHRVTVRAVDSRTGATLGQTSVELVPANATAPLSLRLSVSGPISVEVRADPDAALVDTNRSNNTAIVFINGVDRLNLIANALQVRALGSAQSVVTATVRNAGSQSANGVVLTLREGSARRELERRVVSLAANESRAVSFSSVAMTSGVFEVCADPSNQIAESNENDNCIEGGTGTDTSDLRVAAADLAFNPIGADVGEAVHATAVVRNVQPIASSALVEWWQGAPGKAWARKLGETKIDVPPSASAVAAFDFVRPDGVPEVHVRLRAVSPRLAAETPLQTAGRHLFLDDIVHVGTSELAPGSVQVLVGQQVRVGRLDADETPELVIGYRFTSATTGVQSYAVEVLGRGADGHYALRWRRTYPGRSGADVLLLDVDGDGRGEVIIMTTEGGVFANTQLDVHHAEGILAWSWNWLNGSTVSSELKAELGVGDLNADGTVELVTADTRLRAFDAATGLPVLDVAVTGNNAGTNGEFAVLDRDGTGAHQVLASRPSPRFALYNSSGGTLWTTSAFGSVTNVGIVDLDLDGSPEAVDGQGDFSVVTSLTTPTSTRRFDLDSVWHLAVGALRQDGRPYVTSGRWDRLTGLAGRQQANRFAAYRGDGALQWDSTTRAVQFNGSGIEARVTLADLLGRGRPQVVAASCGAPFFLLDGRDGKELVAAPDSDVSGAGCSTGDTRGPPAVVASLAPNAGASVIVTHSGSSNAVPNFGAPIYGDAEALIFRSPKWKPMPPTWPTRNLIQGRINDSLRFVGGDAGYRWWTTHNTYNQQFINEPARLLADLLITLPSQGTATAGQSFNLTATVKNEGGLPASAVAVAFYDGRPSEGGQRLGTSTADGPLAVRGGQATVSLAWSAWPEGQHTLCAVANPDDSIEESGRENNEACTTLFVRAPTSYCDLSVLPSSLAASPAAALPGDALTLTASITNLGSVACTTSSLSVTDGPAENALSIGVAPIVALAPGQRTSVTLATRASPGTRHFTFTADAVAPLDGDVSNNTAALDAFFTDATQPDLSIAAARVTPTPAFPGEAVQAVLTIRNGGAASPSSLVTLASGPSVAVPPLGAGESFEVTLSLVAGAASSTQLATVDAANTLAEFDETNNARAFTLEVQTPSVSLSTSATPSNAGPNTPVALTVIAANTAPTASVIAVTSTVLASSGSTVATLVSDARVVVPGGGTSGLTLGWNTASTAPGTYVARTVATSAGRVIAQADALITITAGAPSAVASLVFDRGGYVPGQAAVLSFAVNNTSGNLVLQNAEANLTLFDVSGTAVKTEVRQLPVLLVNGRFIGTSLFDLAPRASAGTWSARLEVFQGGTLLAQASAGFAVRVDATKQVTAQSTAPSTFQVGSPVAVSVHLSNPTSAALTGALLKVDLYDVSTATLRAESSAGTVVSLAAGQTSTSNFTLATTGISTGKKLLVVRLDGRIVDQLLIEAVPLTDAEPPTVVITGVSDLQITRGPVSPVVAVSDAHAFVSIVTLDGAPFIAGTSITTEGAHVLEVTAQDEFGNITWVRVRFTIDTTLPVLTLAGVANGATTSTPVTLTFSATDTNLDSVSSTLDGAAFTSGTVVSSSGPHVWVVTALDLAGNRTTETRQFTVDTVAPLITITGVAEGQVTNAAVTLTFSATDTSAVVVSSTLDGVPFASGNAVSTEGAHLLRVTATDAAGNTSTATRQFSIDTTAPLIAAAGVTDGALLRGPVALTFSATDANLDTVNSTLDGAAFTSGTSVSSSGPHVWVITALDLAGNRTTETRRFTLDAIAPLITISGVSEGQFVNTAVTLTFTATDTSAVVVNATLDGVPFNSGNAVSNEGAHLLRVTATDAAGNASTATRQFTIDTTAPVITTAGVTDGALVRGPASPTFSATDANLLSVTATLDGAAFISGNAVSTDGAHTLVVLATDRAGNSASRTVRFTLDSTPPLLSLTGVVNGQLSATPVTPQFSATDAHLTQVVGRLDGVAFTSGTAVTTEGAHTLVVTATDGAGNTAQLTANFRLDFTAPSITITGVTNGATGTSFTPVITVTDASTVTTTSLLDGNAFTSGTTITTAGAHVLSVSARDAVGLVATQTVSFTITASTGQCIDRTFVARRTYSPSSWTDARFKFSRPIDLTVPWTLDVTAGNAGNKKAYLFIAIGPRSARCEYVGGSPVSHPTRSADIAAGRSYRLSRCTNGLTAGATVTTTDVRLHVHEGDSKRGTTEVTWRAQERQPCVGATAQPGDTRPGHHCGHEAVSCEDEDGDDCRDDDDDDDGHHNGRGNGR